MHIAPSLTAWIEALNRLLDAQGEFPYQQMRGMAVRTDYPMREVDYPCIWVGFVPQGDVRNVGIGHVEHLDTPGGVKKAYRWQFSGTIEITIACFGSLERAKFVDALAKAVAFGHADEPGPLGVLRDSIEHNDLIGFRVMWESFVISGFADTPGTPWGTEEVIYEGTITINVEGEYAFAPSTQTLVPLAEVIVADPQTDDQPLSPSPPSDGWR